MMVEDDCGDDYSPRARLLAFAGRLREAVRFVEKKAEALDRKGWRKCEPATLVSMGEG